MSTVVTRPTAAVAERKAVPVKWWAGLGGVIVAFEVFVLVRWITGPYFEHVPPGPTEPPQFMRIALVFWQVVLPAAAIGVIYWFVVRPWRRDGRPGIDGLLVIAFATVWFQDPLSAYGDHWYTYNAWQLNMGSWVNSVPGWMSYGEPGQAVAVPLLVLAPAYICIFILGTHLGVRAMRATKARRPQMGKLGLLAVCFVAMVAFDVVFEGLVFMPLGAWEYPGGHLALFPSTYHKYPLNEALTTGALFTAFAAIKYFVDDRGRTIAERGIDGVQGSERRRSVLRAFAMIAVVQVALFLAYNVPNFWVGLHSTTWPAELQKRSYFTYQCGERTGQACPGPHTPLLRNDNDADGPGRPADTPPVIPYDRGSP